MKKLSFIIISFFIFHFSCLTGRQASAQNPTPNAGFENWTLINGSYEVPDNWDNLNASTSILGQLTCIKTTDAHSGSFACKLETKDLGIAIANGIISTGDLIVIPPYGVQGGIPYNLRPDSITGWCKYTPAAGDSTQIEFLLFNSPTDSVGKALLQISQTITVYTRFSVPVQYDNADIPDSARWLISSSNGYNAVVGSTLYIDDVDLVFSTGIHEINGQQITIGPNPAAQFIHISDNHLPNGTFSIYDAGGREIKHYSMQHEEEYFDVSELSNGIYFYMVHDGKQQPSFSGKLVVLK